MGAAVKIYEDYDHQVTDSIVFSGGKIASSESRGVIACVIITADEFFWDEHNAQWSNWIMVF